MDFEDLAKKEARRLSVTLTDSEARRVSENIHDRLVLFFVVHLLLVIIAFVIWSG